jgi:hypothetical protein
MRPDPARKTMAHDGPRWPFAIADLSGGVYTPQTLGVPTLAIRRGFQKK